MIKFVAGLILGVLLTAISYESGQYEAANSSVGQTAKGEPNNYSFYENFYNTSVTVLEGAYMDESLSTDSTRPTNYFVQLGTFSHEESADRFRAEVILEGYMTSDILVRSTDDHYSVVIGPFAYEQEAWLAMNWAGERNFSSLLLAEN